MKTVSYPCVAVLLLLAFTLLVVLVDSWPRRAPAPVSPTGATTTTPSPVVTKPFQAVVLAANENPFYSFFVPLVAKVWRQRIGVDLVLVLLTRNVHPLVIETTRAMGGLPVLLDAGTWPAALGTGRLMQNVLLSLVRPEGSFAI